MAAIAASGGGVPRNLRGKTASSRNKGGVGLAQPMPACSQHHFSFATVHVYKSLHSSTCHGAGVVVTVDDVAVRVDVEVLVREVEVVVAVHVVDDDVHVNVVVLVVDVTITINVVVVPVLVVDVRVLVVDVPVTVRVVVVPVRVVVVPVLVVVVPVLVVDVPVLVVDVDVHVVVVRVVVVPVLVVDVAVDVHVVVVLVVVVPVVEVAVDVLVVLVLVLVVVLVAVGGHPTPSLAQHHCFLPSLHQSSQNPRPALQSYSYLVLVVPRPVVVGSIIGNRAGSNIAGSASPKCAQAGGSVGGGGPHASRPPSPSKRSGQPTPMDEQHRSRW